MLFAHNENDIKQNSHYELINSLLLLLENFKLYPKSSFNIQFETIKQILIELKKTFFISTSIINTKIDIDIDDENSEKNKNIKFKQSQISEVKIIESYLRINYSCGIEKLCENILKGMLSILNDKNYLNYLIIIKLSFLIKWFIL